MEIRSLTASKTDATGIGGVARVQNTRATIKRSIHSRQRDAG